MPRTPESAARGLLRAKRRLPLGLTSAQYSRLPAAIRERALFSASVTCGRFLEQIRKVCDAVLAGEMSVEQAKGKLGAWLDRTGYKAAPGEEGTIKDLSSDRRLQVVVDTNVKLADGFGREAWQSERQSLFPVCELYRAERRNEPRDWPTRWRKAGGRLRGGRFVAPFGDPIWVRISRFGQPYHIFDYNSGMHKRMIGRAQAKRLGFDVEKLKARRAPKVGLNDSLRTNSTRHWDQSITAAIRSLLPGFRLGSDGVLRKV